MTGRWTIDCGHDDWHAELHPFELVASSHTETKPDAAGKNGVGVSVLITGAWCGGTLDFDIWPPARPSATAALKWSRERGVEIIDGLTVQEEVQPADNPNHVHVKVVSARPWEALLTKDYNDVYYNVTRRLVTKYHLWWAEQAPIPLPNPRAEEHHKGRAIWGKMMAGRR